jgi:hypothetical protein
VPLREAAPSVWRDGALAALARQQPLFVPMNKWLPVWSHKKIAMQNYRLTAGCGDKLGEASHGHNARLGLGRFNYRLPGRL